jgi:hypothetical protein
VSVSVPVETLHQRIKECGDSAFLVTASAEGRVHVVSAAPRIDGATLMVSVGRTARANVAVNPSATLLWPRSPDGAYSLIVDGLATAGAGEDDELRITPSHAVLHRLANVSSDLPRCVPIE